MFVKTSSPLKKYLFGWVRARNFYCNWISKTKLRFFFSKKGNTIYGLSPWWATTLVSKDNLNNKKWYEDLKNLIDKTNLKNKINQENLFVIKFISKFLKNFVTEIIWFFVIKLVSFSRFKNLKEKNCFHSFNYNFFWDNELKKFTDRCYRYLYERKNLDKNFYLITIVKKYDYFKNFFNHKNNKSIIADEFIELNQIIYTYFKSIIILIKLHYFLKKNKKLFYINNVDCSEVLLPMLISSFAGEIQTCIIRGLSIKNYLQKKHCNIFLSYGEFTPQYRPIYFFIRSLKTSPTIFTFQHGNANKNLLYNCNNKKDFSFKNTNLEGTIYSPKPDFYLTQGKQFDDILNKYFKNSKIIGSLKYDGVSFKKNNNKNIIKKIVICPSVGDDDVILEMLIKAVSFKHKYYISPHPTYKFIAKKFVNKLSDKCNIKYINNKTTKTIVLKSDLVITGFSSVAYEAAIAGIPSLRLLDLSKPHYHETNDKIKMIYDPLELKKILSKDSFKQIKLSSKKQIENFMFYKLDSKAYLRMWSCINKLKN